jgi:hypothetical protein
MRYYHFLIVFAALAQVSWADVVELKDGRKITGRVLLFDGQQLRVSVGDKIEPFGAGDLVSIHFGEETKVFSSAPASANTPSATQIPAGTVIAVRTIDAIDSKNATVGQTFQASLDEPLLVNGNTLAPQGASARLKLIQTQNARKLIGRASLSISLVSVKIGDQLIGVNTADVTSSSSGKGKGTATKAGVGAATGAALGGIFGGGLGAGIGAAVGGGAGTGIAMMTRGPRVTIPSETRLSFTVK